jgi:hypothetical protein
MSPRLKTFRVVRDDGRTRVDTDGDVLGWGVVFPSGLCIVDWNREAYPPEQRLDHPHLSHYGSMADVEQGTGGAVELMNSREVPA